MSARSIAIVDTGIANKASIVAAFARLSWDPVLTTDARVIRDSRASVLPGVGAFGAGMERLRLTGLDDALSERVRAERPTLAVCLGLQLLCASSEESPGVEGLAIIDRPVGRFPSGVRVPQFGWNRVEPGADAELVAPGFAYFANSYRLEHTPPGWISSTATHGSTFVAALERGPILACQFHPELSGAWGRSLLERWLSLCA